MGKPENEIEHYLVCKSKKKGILCKKFTSPGTIGVPDRILIGYGQVIFAEIKAPGKKPRLAQQIVIDDMRKHGATVVVLDTKQQIDTLIENLMKGNKIL